MADLPDFMTVFWHVWIFGGAALAPVSLWWARRGWLELDRRNGGDPASFGEVAFGYFAVTALALFRVGLLVPLGFFLLRRLVIDKQLEKSNG